MKINYDLIAISANKISNEMVLNYDNPERSLHYRTLYLAYLEACGWTESEFDSETLKRVDNSWEDKQLVLN